MVSLKFLVLAFSFLFGSVQATYRLDINANRQDSPIFYNSHPIKDMQAFALLLPENFNAKPQVVREMEKIGAVVPLKRGDMRGFGAGNMLIMQISPIQTSSGKQLPVTRLSLHVESHVTIDKTGVHSFPYVWGVSYYIDGKFDALSEKVFSKEVGEIMDNFTTLYREVNGEKKATFYLYD